MSNSSETAANLPLRYGVSEVNFYKWKGRDYVLTQCMILPQDQPEDFVVDTGVKCLVLVYEFNPRGPSRLLKYSRCQRGPVAPLRRLPDFLFAL
jgi:hypothetical protein